MNKIKAAALAAVVGAAVAFPTVSLAQMKGDSGWYVGGNVGMADFDEFGDDDMSFKILGGYQINKHFAAELAYTDFGKVSIAGFDVKGNAIELVGVGSLPINDKFSVFGKLGFAKGELKAAGDSEDSVEVTYGIGVQYNFTPALGIRGEYQMYTDVGDGITDVSVLSVGVVYRFK